MKFTIKIIIIRHKKESEIWAAHQLPDDQDNYVQLHLPPDKLSHKDAAEFIENFGAGELNARYMQDSQAFEVDFQNKDIDLV